MTIDARRYPGLPDPMRLNLAARTYTDRPFRRFRRARRRPLRLLVLQAVWVATVLAASIVAQATERPLARFEPVGDGAGTAASLLERISTALLTQADGEFVDAGDDERRLRQLEQATTDALAAEGWFTPRLVVEADPEGLARHRLRVQTGPRARIESVDIGFDGALARDPARVAALRAGWGLAAGAPFRDADWSAAKAKLLDRVRERDFAAAALVDSAAEVDPDSATVRLRLTVDSGPAFTLGALQITGLARYDAALVVRYRPFQPGDPYDTAKLLEFQRRLQQSQFFSSVIVEVDPAGPAAAAPVRVELTEAKTQRAALGIGMSTDTGARVEGTYRRALLFGRPYTLSSGASVDRTRSAAFADLLLPRRADGWQDSLGVLREHTDIEDQRTSRWAAGAKRMSSRDSASASYETLFALTLEDELRSLADGSAPQHNQVLAGSWTWTRRAVDEVTQPTRGDLLTLSGTLGLQRGSLGQVLQQSFVRLYGRYTRWIPLTAKDRLIVRGEAGHVFVKDAATVPNAYLFRTGGVNSVRGYAYDSLGVRVGTATTGSQELLVGSGEYVRWFGADWGGALFGDIGDAADDLRHVRLARGYGFGARYRTLAGPLALDIAYGERTRQWRAHFSIAIAF